MTDRAAQEIKFFIFTGSIILLALSAAVGIGLATTDSSLMGYASDQTREYVDPEPSYAVMDQLSGIKEIVAEEIVRVLNDPSK